jgi:hypothetical protein
MTANKTQRAYDETLNHWKDNRTVLMSRLSRTLDELQYLRNGGTLHPAMLAADTHEGKSRTTLIAAVASDAIALARMLADCLDREFPLESANG